MLIKMMMKFAHYRTGADQVLDMLEADELREFKAGLTFVMQIRAELANRGLPVQTKPGLKLV